jgi:hypothetical protein
LDDKTLFSGLTPRDGGAAGVYQKLWQLLRTLTLGYTGRRQHLRPLGDGAGAPAVGLVSAWLRSGRSGQRRRSGARRLEDKDLNALFQKGLTAVKMEIEAGKALLKQAEETALDVENTSYSGTVGELRAFLRGTITIILRTRSPACSIIRSPYPSMKPFRVLNISTNTCAGWFSKTASAPGLTRILSDGSSGGAAPATALSVSMKRRPSRPLR